MAYRILSIRAQIRPNWEVQLTYISFPSYLLCRFMLYFFDIFMSKITSDKTAGKQFSLILVCWSTDIYGKVQKQSRKENCKKQQKKQLASVASTFDAFIHSYSPYIPLGLGNCFSEKYLQFIRKRLRSQKQNQYPIILREVKSLYPGKLLISFISQVVARSCTV